MYDINDYCRLLYFYMCHAILSNKYIVLHSFFITTKEARFLSPLPSYLMPLSFFLPTP